ncbi:hypothetical protein [Marinobacter sp. CHS3-4]|uniref:hypothetical protein n=1 Tax=Marinobacter sp. CHS3-4 TaxID=3045174 RepID=UPI0024B62B52|nr:hypothetical protein [Marinobacter sp. CHS3-4]MDI9243886.1 hypothetical protein [Marinobacter sp. CHS3-4]
MHSRRGLCWLVAALLSMEASANERCLSAADTDLERLYCEVISEGGGAGLPSQPDFNRNDPQVQALLLKRPAQRLGLKVPKPTRSQNEQSALTPQAAERSEPRQEQQTQSEPEPKTELAGCRLNGKRIRCSQGDYRLAENQRKSALEEGVLEPDNQLRLEPFEGSLEDEGAVIPYLSRAYDQYIPKMLRIGLGANTMSFTAFHNAFHTLEGGGVDFSDRMAETYELLKQDRQQLGVKTRYHDDLPDNLSLCDFINRDVLVCDNVGTNWVYVRADR